MAAITFRLQDLIAPASDDVQDKQDAKDIQAYKTIVVQVRKPVAAAAGTLSLEHSATLDDDAFQAISGATYELANTRSGVSGSVRGKLGGGRL